MNCWHFITKLLALMQLLQLSENTPQVQLAKQQMQAEINSSTGQLSLTHPIKATTVTATTIKTTTTTTNLKNIKRQYNHSKQQHHGHRQQQRRLHSRWRTGQRGYRWHDQHKHWLTREQRHRAAFGRWTRWSECSVNCVQRRERVCRLKRKCGHTKHIEERKCWRCPAMNGSWPTTATASSSLPSYANGSSINAASTTIINAAAAPATAVSTSSISKTELSTERNITPTESYDNHSSFHDITSATSTSTANTTTAHRHQLHFENVINGYDDRDDADESDFYILRQKVKRKPKSKRNRDTTSLEDKTTTSTTNRKRNLLQQDNTLMDGDIFQYEDFDLDLNHEDNHYSDVSFSSSSASYEESLDYDGEQRNSTYLDFGRERATPDHLIPRQRRIYSKWSRWTKCSPKCTTRRYKKCRVREQCGREVLREIAYCYTEGSFCQQWLQAQLQKSTAYEMKPMPSRRREINSEGLLSNSIYSDFIMNSKGYRGPEYTPMKLKCGLAAIRNNRRNLYSMLKIIGGKASRKGEWPWQVAIFNRYKEAFCGGTLIAPQWILTAAHCVRKVLYVRLGEHNLDYEDGSELQLRILKSYKHPNFDKKTVDSDVALLRLPKPINTTTWIGYSCLPQPYQPLPKYMDCTVIGWGKRRNRDMAGTSVLHQADVPIIPMDNCRSVYQDYTITKNMFCAGHRRGRIDTCAGDSGGPLLCRDTTKPNHPWTIFGITSFGDGCAKRNKFGIYAKVPNYVDWIWSVINCNGNCKTFQRTS